MTWTSSNDAIATVDASGIVTAGSVTGIPVTITATQGDSIFVPGDTRHSDQTVLIVTDTALTSIAVTAENDTTSITTGSPLQLTATGTYGDATTTVITSSMTWSSSDTTIATVDTAGLVTAVGPGTATITATDPITVISGNIAITVN
jgi:uncharacterized protein YjdB